MASTPEDICNRALLRIGQKLLIKDLESDDTAEAELCNVLYGACRDEVLAAFPWPFATKHGFPALLGNTRSGWQYAYAAPTDMLQAQYIYAGFRRGSPIVRSPVASPLLSAASFLPLGAVSATIAFAVESNDTGDGRIVLTDQPQAELIYTCKVENVLAFTPPFVDTLAWKIASELAIALPIKTVLAERAVQQYEKTFARAGAQAFRESTEDAQPDSDVITVRG